MTRKNTQTPSLLRDTNTHRQIIGGTLILVANARKILQITYIAKTQTHPHGTALVVIGTTQRKASLITRITLPLAKRKRNGHTTQEQKGLKQTLLEAISRKLRARMKLLRVTWTTTDRRLPLMVAFPSVDGSARTSTTQEAKLRLYWKIRPLNNTPVTKKYPTFAHTYPLVILLAVRSPAVYLLINVLIVITMVEVHVRLSTHLNR